MSLIILQEGEQVGQATQHLNLPLVKMKYLTIYGYIYFASEIIECILSIELINLTRALEPNHFSVFLPLRKLKYSITSVFHNYVTGPTEIA